MSGIAALVGAEPLQVALTTSTTDGCNIVLGGLGLGPDDEIVTTTDEHFGLLGALATSGAQDRRRRARPRRDPRRRHAADAAARALAGDLDDGPGPAGARAPGARPASRSSSTAPSRSARSPSPRPGSTTSRSRARSGSAGRTATGALVVADPDGLEVSAPSYFSQADYEPDGQFQPKPGAARFDPGWWPPSSLAGLLAALDSRPSWAFDHAAAVAERCRELLAEPGRGGQPGRARALDARRLPSRRRRRPRSSRRSTAPTCTCARSRAPGLIRVSCGWWTSDGDLDRLLAGLADVTDAGLLPLRRRPLHDRRPRARRDRLPLRRVPGGDRRAVAGIGRLPARSRRRRRGGAELGARRRLRARREPGPLPLLRDGRVLGRARPRHGLVRGGAARRRRAARGCRAHLGAGGERAALAAAGVPVEPQGLPASVSVRWHDEARTTG